jgi:hypothetical protein
MDIWAESSKDVIDTWPKYTWSAAGGGGSDTIVETGGWGAADEHALGGPTFGVEALGGAAFGEPIFCPVCCENAVGERTGPEPDVGLWAAPTGAPAVIAVDGSPAALGVLVDQPR